MKQLFRSNPFPELLAPKYRSFVSMVVLVAFEVLLVAFVTADWNAAGRTQVPAFPQRPAPEDPVAYLAGALRDFQVSMALVIMSTVVLLWLDQWKKSQLSQLISCVSLLLCFGLMNQVQFCDVSLKFLILSLAAGFGFYFLGRNSLLLTCDAAVLAYAGGILLLALWNLLLGKAPEGTGARLWVSFLGIRFQPSEAIKVLLLLLLGAVTSNRKFRPLATALSVAMPIFYVLMKDLGNAALMGFVTVLCLFFLYDRKWIPVASMALLIGVFLVVNLVEVPAGSRYYYVWQRFQPVPVDMSDHQGRLLVGIGSSGILFGLGTRLSSLVTKIFAGSSDCALGVFLALYGLPMFLLLLAIVSRTLGLAVGRSFRHPAYFVCALGFSGYLFASYLLNFLGSVGCVPFTGIVALFLSTGGTALMCTMAMVGLVAAGLNPRGSYHSIFLPITQWSCSWEDWMDKILPKKGADDR